MTKTPDDKPAAEPKKRRRAASGRANFLWTFFVVLALTLAVAGIAVPGPLLTPRTIVIPRGTSVHGVAVMLKTNEVIYDATLFRLAAKLGAHDQLKAGEYQFAPLQSTADIVDMMHEGRSIVHSFTIAEGLTSAEVTSLLKNMPGLTSDVAPPPEGSLLPETYHYSFGDSREGLVMRMQKAMQDALNDAWAKRDMSVSLKSPQEAVVMASVVEKETAKPDERARIASVFYNRLSHNMRLQSDPTVIYAITKARGLMDHDLDHHDLEFPSPYNTYMSDGLPPQPICNPGRASLEAVLHPEKTNYLYFVADGTGGHVFATNLDEHNRNVAKSNKVKK